jgi:hypothetical protein
MIFIADILEKSWYMPYGDTSEYQDDCIEIGFIKDNSSSDIYFTDLSFGYDLELPSGEIFSDSFPKNNLVYISSSQELLDRSMCPTLNQNEVFQIKVWAKNDDQYWEDTFIIYGGMIEKPYPSWTFDEDLGFFVAPVPPPEQEDGERPFWDEENQAWVFETS